MLAASADVVATSYPTGQNNWTCSMTVEKGYGEYVGVLSYARSRRRRGRTVIDLSWVTVEEFGVARVQFVRFPGRLAKGATPLCKGHRVRVSCYVYQVFPNGLGGNAHKETIECMQPEEHVLDALARL